MSTYHTDADAADQAKYLIYQRDTFRRQSELIAETENQVDIMTILYDNLDSEKSGYHYRYEYEVVKVIGVREREVARTTYSVTDIEKFPRDEM